MPRALYAFTHYTSEHGITYTCNTYPASLSRKYGICQSLHNPDMLDLRAVSWGPVSAGNVISACVLIVCVLIVLGALKWGLDELRRRRREWWLREREGQKSRLFGGGGGGGLWKERMDGGSDLWVNIRERGARREWRLS